MPVSGVTETTCVAMTSVSCIRSSVRRVGWSCEQQGRRLEVALDGLEQPRAVGPGARAVVARERDRHDVADASTAPSRTTGRSIVADTARMVDSGGLMMAANAETSSMPMFETVNVPPSISGWRELPGPRALGEVAGLGGDAAQALRVGVAEHRHDQAVVERDRDPDVRVGVVDVPAVDVRAVRLGMQRRAPGRRRAR